MGAVVRAKLGENIRNVTLNGPFADRELIRNLLVSIPGSDQPQYVDLPWGQLVIRSMVRELLGDFRRYSFLPSVYCANGVQKFSIHKSLHYVSLRARFQGPYYLGVACVRR